MSDPDDPEGIDTEGRTLPPYEGRRDSADVDPAEESTKDGARVAGATGPVEDEEPKAADPDATPGGQTASPADEQPAAAMPETDSGDEGVGPAHTPGTGRAEDTA